MKAQAKAPAWGSAGLKSRLLTIALAIGTTGLVVVSVFAAMGWCDLVMGLLALVVCLAASIGAHIVGDMNSAGEDFAMRLALGMAVRTAPPFFLVLIAKLSPAIPFEPGFVFSLILFYLVGLFVDVSLHVARLKVSE